MNLSGESVQPLMNFFKISLENILVVAEIELASETEAFVRPAWLGAEVSSERRYYNVCLIDQPFSSWR